MLRDPHHDLNLVSFRDFAASKPPQESYEYPSRSCCACGQFARHVGLHDEWLNAFPMGETLPEGRSIWQQFNAIALGDPWRREDGEWTWGKLRDRLDAKLEKQEQSLRAEPVHA